MLSGGPALELEGEPGYEPESDLVGAGGTYTWRVRAAETGTGEIEMTYSQPWDKETPPAEEFSVSIEVVDS